MSWKRKEKGVSTQEFVRRNKTRGVWCRIVTRRRLLLIIATCIIFLIAVFYCTCRFSPFTELETFDNRQWSTTYCDRYGNLLQVTPQENGVRREFTSLDEIPEAVIKAFIVAEDSRFFYHHGVDYLSVVRAAFQNVTQQRQVSGASTITMQLARMISPSNSRNFSAKLHDVWNAWRLETRFSKDEILELYLNSIPFGFNVEGVTTAVRFFFDSTLDDLTIEQIVCLAVIPRRPSLYNPFDHATECATAAYRLYNSLNPQTVTGAVGAQPTGNSTEGAVGAQPTDNSSVGTVGAQPTDESAYKRILATAQSATRFLWPLNTPHLIRHLETNAAKAQQVKGGVVNLSIDLDLQRLCEYKMSDELRNATSSRIENGAVIVIKNKTGEVLSWVGSNDWFNEENSGQIDGVLTPNQPGSSMKPFLYALALEDGYTPTDVFSDVPMEFGGANLYIPMNFNNRFNGPVLFRTSLASSLNVPAVYLLSQLGVARYLDCLETLGFKSLTGVNRQIGMNSDLGLALGAGEVSLAELACAFSVFPRDGVYLPLSFYKTQTVQNTHSQNTRQVFTRDTARIICDILSDKSARVTGFGYTQTFETDYPSIFKTGTANQYQNIVALGATTDYTVGVWMGNFSGNTVIGKTGSSLPASIAKTVLDYLVEQQSEQPNVFEQPENWTRVNVCALSGMIPSVECPSTRSEYIKNDDLNEFISKPCTWHTENGIVYPSVYQRWFDNGNKSGSINYYDEPLTIVSPTQGSTFYYDETLSSSQKISVEVIGGRDVTISDKTVNTETLTVVYDGRLLSTIIKRPFSFTLPVERGNHLLTVSLGSEEYSVAFSVK